MKSALHALTMQGLASIQESSFGWEGFGGAIAYYDSRKDKLVTDLPAFSEAVNALEESREVSTLFGVTEARRIALQFVFNAYPLVCAGSSVDVAFDTVWNGFVRELTTPTWTFAAVANLQNIDCSEDSIEIEGGISVRGRSFRELETLLGWSQSRLKVLAEDWETGGASSFVLFLQKKVPKTPDNFMLLDDGTAYLRAARALRALRLVAPGDVRIGRLFLARPTCFNVGIGNMQSQGISIGHSGRQYSLTPDLIPNVRRWFSEISMLEEKGEKQIRNLALALRSFSSMYDRHFHQDDDRILDAITALEALWKLDAELAFRLSFRTGALLGATDDECVAVYETVAQYYKIRSKIVHGSRLNDTESRLVFENEPIRDVVRRTLRAFLHLANHPGEWTLPRLDKEADVALLHAGRRQALRASMALPSEPSPNPALQGTQASIAALTPRH